MVNHKKLKCQNDTLKIICLLLIAICIALILYVIFGHKKTHISNDMVRNKYNSLVSVLGNPTYLEKDGNNQMRTATWMSPLNNVNDFGKFGGCDLIKIHNDVSKKYHPHPAKVFLIIGKYINVPEHLLGPIKHASETINIEQLFVPEKYAEKYYNTGQKEVAMVTGSCASVTISAITVQFVMDMIEKYKTNTNQCLELYPVFRKEYDRRINDYLCGKGITNNIPWFDNNPFGEPTIYNIGEEKCQNVELFTVCPMNDIECRKKIKKSHEPN